MNLHSGARSCPASRALLIERIQCGSAVTAAAGGWAQPSHRIQVDRATRQRGAAQTPGPLVTTPAQPVRSAARGDRLHPAAAALTADDGADREQLGDAALDRGAGTAAPRTEPAACAGRRAAGAPLHAPTSGRAAAPGREEAGPHHRLLWPSDHRQPQPAAPGCGLGLRARGDRRCLAAGLRRKAAQRIRRHQRGVPGPRSGLVPAQDIRVREVLTDNGSGYVSACFGLACSRHRVQHLRTRPHRPCTNGKAERFIQTLLREWAYVRPYRISGLRARALPIFLGYYNRERPHGSLGGRSPISWIRSQREQRA